MSAKPPVQISGYEEWTFGPDGRIARSLGYFDEAAYRAQLQGAAESRGRRCSRGPDSPRKHGRNGKTLNRGLSSPRGHAAVPQLAREAVAVAECFVKLG